MDGLNIVGGDPAIDLVNTVEPRIPGEPGRDHLDSASSLVQWAAETGLVSPAEAAQIRTSAAGPAMLRHVRELREAIYSALRGVSSATEDASDSLHLLSRRWARATGRATLSLDDPVVVVGPEPGTLIEDRLALAAVDLLRTMDARRLKTCPVDQGGCGWYFLDTSKNGSRRWCAMEDCGAQVKARRLTERRRAARTR